jgi:hypothetical protein
MELLIFCFFRVGNPKAGRAKVQAAKDNMPHRKGNPGLWEPAFPFICNDTICP